MPSLFDINSYKQKIQNIVYQETGNTLEIKGAINLAIFPIPTLKLEGIKYYKNKEDILFNSNKLVIVPEILSFIKGNIVFKSIKLVKPLVFIKVYGDKSNNWSNPRNDANGNFNISNKDEKKRVRPKSKKHKKFNPLNIKELIIRDAKLIYESNEHKYQLNNLELSLNYLKDNNYIIEGHLNYNSEQIDFSYKLSDRKPLLYVKGFIKNKSHNFSNELQVDIDSFKGKSKFSLYINKIHSLYRAEYLKPFPLDIKGDLIFSKENLEFKKIEIISKNSKLNGQAIYNFSKNKKTINIEMKANHIDLNNYISNNTFANKKNQDIQKISSRPKKESKVNIEEDIFMILEDYNIFLKMKFDKIQYKNIIAQGIDLSLNKREAFKLNLTIKDIFNGNIVTDIKIYNNKKIDLYLESKNIEMEQVNNVTGHKYIIGNIDLLTNVKGKLKNKNILKKSLSGNILVKNKNTYLNNINLDRFKKNILKIKNISDISKVKDEVFQGSTKIKNSKHSLIINQGVLKLPSTNLHVDKGLIAIKGSYNLVNNKMNINFNFNEQKNLILSLFKIKVNGNLNNISTNIDYDKGKTEKILNKFFKDEMKVMIKKKLDRKFNNVIENLLE